MGGLMSITGLPGQGPVRVGIPVADLCAGLFAAQGIFIALLEREASGEGQWVQTSLLQAQIFMLDFQAARWTVSGEVPKQAGNNHPTSIPTGVFKVKDGHVNIASAGQAIWERFCKALGEPDLNANPDYATGKARSQNRDALNAEIDARVGNFTSAELIDRLNAAGVPCGPIYAIDEVFGDPQVRHLGIAQDVTKPDGRAMTLVGQPVTLSRTPSSLDLAPPGAGEQTAEILREFGVGTDEVEGLRGRGVV
jgi:formyl-CoA transferase